MCGPLLTGVSSDLLGWFEDHKGTGYSIKTIIDRLAEDWGELHSRGSIRYAVRKLVHWGFVEKLPKAEYKYVRSYIPWNIGSGKF